MFIVQLRIYDTIEDRWVFTDVLSDNPSYDELVDIIDEWRDFENNGTFYNYPRLVQALAYMQRINYDKMKKEKSIK